MRRHLFGTVVGASVVSVSAAAAIGLVAVLPGLQGLREALSTAVADRVVVLRPLWTMRGAQPPATLAQLAAGISEPAPGEAPGLAIAAGVGGHWTIANRAGERMTVADAGELRRALELLAPNAPGRGRPLQVILADDVATADRARLDELPVDARVSMMVGSAIHQLHGRAGEVPERWWAEIYPGVLLQLSDRARFLEARRRLLEPLEGRGPVLATLVAPGHEGSTTARRSTNSEQLLVPTDAIASALRARAGRLVLLTGDVRRDAVEVAPAGGRVANLPLAHLRGIASASGVDLVVLAVGTPRQAGERNWLWLRQDVAGLEGARAAHLAALAVRLVGRRGAVLVTAEPGYTRDRLAFRMEPVRSPGVGFGGVLDGVAAQVTGTLAAESLRADVMSDRRRAEIALRIVPSLPAWIQLGYLAALALGLAGTRRAVVWWRRLWPPRPTPSRGTTGPVRLARPLARAGRWLVAAVRGLAFWLIFLPVAGLPSLLASAASRLFVRRRLRRTHGGGRDVAFVHPAGPAADSAGQPSTRRSPPIGDAPLGRLDDGGAQQPRVGDIGRNGQALFAGEPV